MYSQKGSRVLGLLFLSFSLPILIHASKLMEYCSPPGPHIPYVSANTLRTSPLVKQKLAELTKFLEEISTEAENPLLYELNGEGMGGINLAVSITTPTETIYNFNHGLRTKLEGTNPWTEHTVFRVASVSKALTVWELVKLGIGWDEKITRYLPELGQGKYGKEWAEVTVGALAGYNGGAIRDFEHDISLRPDDLPDKLYKRDGSSGSRPGKNGYFIPEDSLYDIDGYVESIWISYLPEFLPSEAWKMGFPPLEEMEEKRCFYNCTRKDVLTMLANHPLVYPAHTNPSYSNIGFSLLGLLLERKTGLSFESLMQRDMYDPLGMKDTFHKLPQDAAQKGEGWGAHPFWGANDTWWETREIWGDWGVPAGGIFTSAHDLSIFIRTILAAFPYATDASSYPNKHSILPAMKVREWLTPSGFTGGKGLVGRPWEIKRKKYPDCHGDRAVTLYSKAGGGTGYNAGITIIPELGVGITILIAGDGGRFKSPDGARYSFHWTTIRRMLLEQQGLLKAIEQAAYGEAEKSYLGEYLFNSFMLDGDDGTNAPLQKTNIPNGPIFSGMELIRDNGPGLRIKRWISNGTDFLGTMKKVKMQMSMKEVEGAVAVARMYPIGNIRQRGAGRWAEDWRIWFEWEWENLPQENPMQANFRPSQTPPIYKPWSRGRSKAQSQYHSPPADIPWEIYPDILPGGGRERPKAASPQQQEEEIDAEEPTPEDVPSSRRKKGWAKPTKSSATTSNSEDDAHVWNNNQKRPWWRAKYGGRRKKSKMDESDFADGDDEAMEEEMSSIGVLNKDKFLAYSPAVAENKHRIVSPESGMSDEMPLWWRDKFDDNEQLRKYRNKKKIVPEELSEGEEDAKNEQQSAGNNKKDRVINYTYKKAEAHGSGTTSDGDAEGDQDDDLEGVWFPRHAFDGSANAGQDSENYMNHVQPKDDESDDEDFYIPDYPPHAPLIPLVFDMPLPQHRNKGKYMFPSYPDRSDDMEDGGYFDNQRGGPHMRNRNPMQEDIAARWNFWKESEEGWRAEQRKTERKRWPCTDYNGIELQSWAGWSLGLIRLLREGPDRRVIGMEVPALKIRLGKVGQGVLRGGRRGGRRQGQPVGEPKGQNVPSNVHAGSRGRPWSRWEGKKGRADEL